MTESQQPKGRFKSSRSSARMARLAATPGLTLRKTARCRRLNALACTTRGGGSALHFELGSSPTRQGHRLPAIEGRLGRDSPQESATRPCCGRSPRQAVQRPGRLIATESRHDVQDWQRAHWHSTRDRGKEHQPGALLGPSGGAAPHAPLLEARRRLFEPPTAAAERRSVPDQPDVQLQLPGEL